VTFIGSLSNGPTTVSNKAFPRNHEGHDGFTVTQITGYLPPAKAFPSTPHIVLLHIGTNDMTMNADPTTTANQLSTLIADLVNAAPEALIVHPTVIPRAPLFVRSSAHSRSRRERNPRRERSCARERTTSPSPRLMHPQVGDQVGGLN
jgi:hypothetical protein